MRFANNEVSPSGALACLALLLWPSGVSSLPHALSLHHHPLPRPSLTLWPSPFSCSPLATPAQVTLACIHVSFLFSFPWLPLLPRSLSICASFSPSTVSNLGSQALPLPLCPPFPPSFKSNQQVFIESDPLTLSPPLTLPLLGLYSHPRLLPCGPFHSAGSPPAGGCQRAAGPGG